MLSAQVKSTPLLGLRQLKWDRSSSHAPLQKGTGQDTGSAKGQPGSAKKGGQAPCLRSKLRPPGQQRNLCVQNRLGCYNRACAKIPILRRMAQIASRQLSF